MNVHNPRGWWQDAVGYQVYLPSFADSDGDGWGDLPGVTAHLDHFVDLAIDVIWLTPFFPSPMRDHGYDVADYRGVDPSFGGPQALQEFLDAAHARGLRVLGDLVVNHTSDQHPWFTAARSARDDPHRDYYIWRDPGQGGGLPNNWLSHFGGPAWTLDEVSGQYYLHLFSPQQPDLNWRNPAVADEVDAVLEHWFTRGLDGMRIDTAACLLKHPDLPDNPLLPDGQLSAVRGVALDWRKQDHRHDFNQPDVHTIHERWRRVADRHGAFLVGEIYELDPLALARFVTDERLHSSFWFGLVETDWDPHRVQDMLVSAAQASPRLSWVQGNHDRPRAATRYGGGRTGARRSLALHALMAFLPGTLWLYQGEELGLPDGAVPPGQGHDPLSAAQPEASRDAARTPMPWAPEPGLGFTTGRAWLPDGGRHPDQTAAAQAADPASHLRTLTRLLTTRRWLHQHRRSAGDTLHELDPRLQRAGITGYRRGTVTAMANLTDTHTVELDLRAPAVYDSDDARVTPSQPRRGRVLFAPQQALILDHTRKRMDFGSAHSVVDTRGQAACAVWVVLWWMISNSTGVSRPSPSWRRRRW